MTSARKPETPGVDGINSRMLLKRYLEADRTSLGIPHSRYERAFIAGSEVHRIWLFQRALRKYEFAINSRPRLLRLCARYLYLRRSARLNFSVPPNVFGPGLQIAHVGGVVVNGAARIGSNCRVHAGVNIGTAAGHANAAPIIGDNVYIGPGAKLFGTITIGSSTVIGANAVVTKDFPDGSQTLAGVPARVISQESSAGMVTLGWQPDEQR